MADGELRDRRRYLRLAREVVAWNEDNLKEFDSKYKAKKDRLLFKLLLATIDNNNAVKQRRLNKRIDTFSKVKSTVKAFKIVSKSCLFVKKCKMSFQVQQRQRRRLVRVLERSEMSVIYCRAQIAIAKKGVWTSRLRQR